MNGLVKVAYLTVQIDTFFASSIRVSVTILSPVMRQSRHFHATLSFLIGFCISILLVRQFRERNPTNDVHRLIGARDYAPMINRLTLPRRSIVDYLSQYRTNIEGSSRKEILYAIWVVAQFQYRWLNIVGSIGEIGPHHGQLTTFLYLMRRYRGQRLFAVEPTVQSDESIRRRKKIILHNVLQYADAYEDEISIHFGPTLELNPVFHNLSTPSTWWNQEIVAGQAIQLISVRSILLVFFDFELF